MSGRLSASCTSGKRGTKTGPAALSARFGMVLRITARSRSGCLAIIHFRNFAASPGFFFSAMAAPLNRFQEFDDCVAFFGRQGATDNPVIVLLRGVLVGEFVPGVPIGGFRGIENEVAGFLVVVLPFGVIDRLGHDADLHRIEGGVAEQECFRAVCRGSEQVVQRRNGAVMQEWRGRPYPVQW